jgi:hypothetical protein
VEKAKNDNKDLKVWANHFCIVLVLTGVWGRALEVGMALKLIFEPASLTRRNECGSGCLEEPNSRNTVESKRTRTPATKSKQARKPKPRIKMLKK